MHNSAVDVRIQSPENLRTAGLFPSNPEAAAPSAVLEPLTGDASTRRYFRVRHGRDSVVLMDASRNRESIEPFVRIARHLSMLGFSAPTVLARDDTNGFLLLEDFGDASFARLLDSGVEASPYFELAIDLLATLHQEPKAVPDGLRRYDPEKMLSDIELFLEWRTPGLDPGAVLEFRSAWLEVLPLAQQVPGSLLLRDFHAGNLMFLVQRQGVRRAGLLDFQDAYAGPITYDVVSLLQDARRDITDELRTRLIDRYLESSPVPNRADFDLSLAVLAAQRHTRVLAIFERLARNANRPEYKTLHSPRVEKLLRRALKHPALDRVRLWMNRHALQD